MQEPGRTYGYVNWRPLERNGIVAPMAGGRQRNDLTFVLCFFLFFRLSSFFLGCYLFVIHCSDSCLSSLFFSL